MGCRSFSLSPNLKSNDFGGRKGVGEEPSGFLSRVDLETSLHGKRLSNESFFLPFKLVQLGEMLFFDKAAFRQPMGCRSFLIWKRVKMIDYSYRIPYNKCKGAVCLDTRLTQIYHQQSWGTAEGFQDLRSRCQTPPWWKRWGWSREPGNRTCFR